ncbi:Wzz/FepE/Etk N-terminal domain-containing protein [Pseudomonas aeruginosa]
MSDKQSSEAVNYEVDFMELIRELWKSRWLVVLSGFFLGLLAALYAYLSKPVYEARVICTASFVKQRCRLQPGAN